MRQLDRDEPPPALGAPINRKPEPGLTPMVGRPNWFRDKRGEPVYVEPPRPINAAKWIPDFWRRVLNR